MDFHRFLGAIRKSWWLFVLLVVLGAGGGYAYSARQTPLYASHISFYVGTPLLSSNNANATNQFAQDRATSYATLLSSDVLAQQVLDASGMKGSPHALAKEIKASAQLNTVIVDATITDSSPARAQRIARYVGQVFPSLVGQLDDSGQGDSTVKLSVISGPTGSSVPVSPRTRLNEILGAGLGLLLALAIAVVRELMDVSISSGEAMRSFSGLPVLASVPFDRRAKAAPLLVGDRASSPRAEALRQLRTNLRFMDATHPVRLLQITSSVEGEGKSTTAANLAMLMAEDGRSVLLIEADVRKPTASRLFGVESAVGLTDVLAGMADLDEVLQPWGESRLTILPAGAPAPNPSELLGSARATELFDTVRHRFDMVIVDSPPVLPVADASVLAPKMDGVLVVFRSGKSRRAHLIATLHQLDSVQARVVGTALNMRPARRVERRAYGNYYANRALAEASASAEPPPPERRSRQRRDSDDDRRTTPRGGPDRRDADRREGAERAPASPEEPESETPVVDDGAGKAPASTNGTSAAKRNGRTQSGGRRVTRPGGRH